MMMKSILLLFSLLLISSFLSKDYAHFRICLTDEDAKEMLKDLKEIHSALSGFGFMIEPLEGELADLTVELAYQYGITIYDASYISISSRNKCDFVTADEKLYNKLTGEKVILLKEW